MAGGRAEVAGPGPGHVCGGVEKATARGAREFTFTPLVFVFCGCGDGKTGGERCPVPPPQPEGRKRLEGLGCSVGLPLVSKGPGSGPRVEMAKGRAVFWAGLVCVSLRLTSTA